MSKGRCPVCARYSCCVCGGRIRPGDRYRERIAFCWDLANKDWVRDLAHARCVRGSKWWTL